MQTSEQPTHKVGRPKRGTELARTTALINAATRVFLREGYGLASIDKVASEAGVSTRTIYERFKNKADLLAAVITRLVEHDMETVLATTELDRLDPRDALTAIAREKEIKKWRRDWKIALIEADNPDWNDLFEATAR